MKWTRAPRAGTNGWVSEDGQWTVRGPIMGKKMFWLYRGPGRHREGESYDHAVSFSSAAAAKRYVEAWVTLNPDREEL